MYRIDSMYEAMVDALLSARKENRSERWMPAVAIWLGRQQMWNAQDFWLGTAIMLIKGLPDEERLAIEAQLSKAEDALMETVTDWPEIPQSVASVVATWTPTPEAVDLFAYLAAKRYQLETGGITLQGMRIETDRQSQSMITGAFAYAKEDPDLTVEFKTKDGFVSLTSAQLTAIGAAVAQHVQASFAKEKEVYDAIKAGTITTTAEIDAAMVLSQGV
ncbi:DUF4376 domain-containing protein [Oryzifoliimicrobium ureilyticus]|uniref:DUF4376 domain-containing protein n=1 Tax=Oryzifoliimicrobium ureilyticus TaxID=3113724 RepID=UPI003076533F